MKLLLLLLLGCVTNSYYARNPIENQILRSRGGILSNISSDGTVSYNLEDAQIRAMLASSRFVCWAGGKRFRICRDKAGLCRNDGLVCTRTFLGICTRHVMTTEFIPQGELFTRYLIECRSETNPAPDGL